MSKNCLDVFRLEELVTELDNLASMAQALTAAMFESGNDPSFCEGAMFLFSDLMHKHNKAMAEFFTDADRRRKGETNVTASSTPEDPCK